MVKNTLNAAQDRYWYGRGQHVASIWGTPEAIHSLSNEAFRAGARWAMRESSALSPHIAQFIEMLILLGVFDGETEDERASPLWHTEGGDQTRTDCASDQEVPSDGEVFTMRDNV